MFKSNAVRSCVELHEIEINRFFEAWGAFRASGTRCRRPTTRRTRRPTTSAATFCARRATT